MSWQAPGERLAPARAVQTCSGIPTWGAGWGSNLARTARAISTASVSVLLLLCGSQDPRASAQACSSLCWPQGQALGCMGPLLARLLRPAPARDSTPALDKAQVSMHMTVAWGMEVTSPGSQARSSSGEHRWGALTSSQHRMGAHLAGASAALLPRPSRGVFSCAHTEIEDTALDMSRGIAAADVGPPCLCSFGGHHAQLLIVVVLLQPSMQQVLLGRLPDPGSQVQQGCLGAIEHYVPEQHMTQAVQLP